MSNPALDGTPPEPGLATPTGPKRRGKVRKRHTVGKVLLSTVVVLALATGLGVVFLYRHLNGNIQVLDPTSQLSNRPAKVDTGPREPLNVLVMGSDSREGKGNNIDGLTGLGARSDTTLLLHDGTGTPIANERIAIARSGSALVFPHAVFGEEMLARAGARGYVLVRDATCRLFGYHGLMAEGDRFSLDHMFGF